MIDSRTVEQLILEHLAEAKLPQAVENLVIAALLGEEQFATQLNGTAPQRPAPPGPRVETDEPIGTYLESIEVTGFRGIGPTATLKLTPGPGLTIVTGRNGSGKSSFAEAAEYALTGDNQRWAGRSTVWQEGWRNLHAAADPRIRVRLGVEGHRNGAVVECHWAADAGVRDCTTSLQVGGERQQSVAELGWATPLELYRPFLSYAELGGLLGGKPSEMYDSLQRILGLGQLVEIETMLKNARREKDQERRRSAELLPALKTTLAAHPDPRARLAEQALGRASADLDQLEALSVTDEAADDATVVLLRQLDSLQLPSQEEVSAGVDRFRAALRQIDELTGTQVEEDSAVASLLRDALRHHADQPDQPCPVCGGRILDEAWAAQAQTQLRRLSRGAEPLDHAYRAESAARDALRRLVPTAPPALLRGVDGALGGAGADPDAARLAWQRWDDLISAANSSDLADTALEVFIELVTAVTPVRVAARAELERRWQAWQPAADRIRDWIETERTSRRAKEQFGFLRKAIEGLQKIGASIRESKLAPVAAEATAIWNTLRQDSNVQLGAIKLTGTGTTRRVDLDVQVDGVPGAALSVMSQGELHSLGLALFLPRATMPASPFRFLVIDDPVQSMDPAKVYGLAQVLAEVATRRQVIVFTHDDRLPAAVRHLQLDARILAVSRLAGSQVMVTGVEGGNPAERYLKDAQAITNDEEMGEVPQRAVVCHLMRDALEYACHERIRIRGYRTGTPIADTEAAIGEAEGLRQTLALALLGDRKRVGELNPELKKLDRVAVELVRALNTGAHGGAAGNLARLIDDTRRLVRRLSQV